MTIDIEPRERSLAGNARKRPTVQSGSSAATPQPPRLPARRNPKWIALGIVALCLGGLLSYLIYTRIATETALTS